MVLKLYSLVDSECSSRSMAGWLFHIQLKGSGTLQMMCELGNKRA